MNVRVWAFLNGYSSLPFFVSEKKNHIAICFPTPKVSFFPSVLNHSL